MPTSEDPLGDLVRISMAKIHQMASVCRQCRFYLVGRFWSIEDPKLLDMTVSDLIKEVMAYHMRSHSLLNKDPKP